MPDLSPQLDYTVRDSANADEVSCASCGYRLVGLSLLAVCPECGTSVKWSLIDNRLTALSAAKADQLYRSAGRSGRAMIARCVLVALASVAFLLNATTGFGSLPGLATGFVLVTRLLTVAAFAGLLVTSIIGATSHWRMTGVVIRDTMRPREAQLARWLRWVALVDEFWPITWSLALAATIWTASNVVSSSASPGGAPPGMAAFFWVQMVILVVSLGMLCVKATWCFLMAQFLLHLAPSLPSARLARRASTLRWLGPVLIGTGSIVGFLAPFAGIAVATIYALNLRLFRHELASSIDSHGGRARR